MPSHAELERRVLELESENFQLRKALEPRDAGGNAAVFSDSPWRQQEYTLRSMLDNIPAMIGYWDKHLHNRFSNKAYSVWFGISPEQLLGKHIRELLGEKIFQLNLPYIEAALRGQRQSFERTIPTPDGSGVRHSLAEYIPDVVNGKVQGFFVQVTDITSLKVAEERIRNLAFYDALTGLPNRRLLDDRLAQGMAISKHSGRFGALMFLDLDHFKPLNDKHGHHVGDLLLTEVARRICRCVRASDTVARFGGDEFVVVLSELHEDKAESAAQACVVAEKIRTALADPYLLATRPDGAPDSVVEHRCTTSIGIVLFINHEASADDVIKWADMAMYQAKDAGRNLIRFYE